MQEFKSKIGNSLGTFFLLTICYLPLFYFILFLTTNFRLTQITFLGWTIVVMTYFAIGYLYAGLTNNDIRVFDDRLEIVNKLPLFKKHVVFNFDKINSIIFKHEWTETFWNNIKSKLIKNVVTEFFVIAFFPYDYKWIKIKTDKDYQFYCLGLEMDYYDNEGPHFEELFNALAEKKIKVSWTDISDIYYQQMTKNIESKKQQT